jgi:hypothetical protein
MQVFVRALEPGPDVSEAITARISPEPWRVGVMQAEKGALSVPGHITAAVTQAQAAHSTAWRVLRSVSKTEWLALAFTLLAAALWWRAIEAPDDDYRPLPGLTLSQRMERVIEANNRAGCALDPVWCRSFLRRLLTKPRSARN